MLHPLPLSCFVITKNEADRLGRTLASIADLAADIVVVDSGSTDDTQAIAEAAGARWFEHSWDGFGPQKRYAEDQCHHHWVLNLDADEVLTPELADEIRALWIARKPPFRGYKFRQVTVYPNQNKPRLWADFHNYIRLYDRTKMRFANSATHDAVEAKGQNIGQLTHPALHFSWRSLAHLAKKYDSYTDLQANTLQRKSKLALRIRLFTEFPLQFFKVYILRRHCTGGWHGLATAAIISRARWRRIAKLRNAAKRA